MELHTALHAAWTRETGGCEHSKDSIYTWLREKYGAYMSWLGNGLVIQFRTKKHKDIFKIKFSEYL